MNGVEETERREGVEWAFKEVCDLRREKGFERKKNHEVVHVGQRIRNGGTMQICPKTSLQKRSYLDGQDIQQENHAEQRYMRRFMSENAKK